MATVVKTYHFTASRESFCYTTSGSTSGSWTAAGGADTPGCLLVGATGKNLLVGGRWILTATGLELGVPAGAIIRGISSGSLKSKHTARLLLTKGIVGPAVLYGPGTATITLANARTFSSTLDATFTSIAGTSSGTLSWTAATSLTLAIDWHADTGNSSGATTSLALDTLALTITYDVGAVEITATPAIVDLAGITAGVSQSAPAYLIADAGLVITTAPVLVPGGLFQTEEYVPATVTVLPATLVLTAGSAGIAHSTAVDAAAATWTLTAPQASVAHGEVRVSWVSLFLADVVSGAAATITLTTLQAGIGQKQALTASAAAIDLLGVAATVTQAGFVTATAPALVLGGGTAIVDQAHEVIVAAPSLQLIAGSVDIGLPQAVTAMAVTLVLAAPQAFVLHDQLITSAVPTLVLEGVAATVVQAYEIVISAPTITWSAPQTAVEQWQYLTATHATFDLTGVQAVVALTTAEKMRVVWLALRVPPAPVITVTPAVIDLVGGTAAIEYRQDIAGTAGEWRIEGGYAVYAQRDTITTTAAVWDITAGLAEIVQTSGQGGRLIRHRRRRGLYDEDTELGKLATLLGQHPPQRDARSLTRAVKAGLTAAFESGAPPPVEIEADGSVLVTLVEQQVRLAGVLAKHVRALQDDQDFVDALQDEIDFLDLLDYVA